MHEVCSSAETCPMKEHGDLPVTWEVKCWESVRGHMLFLGFLDVKDPTAHTWTGFTFVLFQLALSVWWTQQSWRPQGGCAVVQLQLWVTILDQIICAVFIFNKNVFYLAHRDVLSMKCVCGEVDICRASDYHCKSRINQLEMETFYCRNMYKFVCPLFKFYFQVMLVN